MLEQIISLLVENKPGALMRITGVLGARGYNIESLTVAQDARPDAFADDHRGGYRADLRPVIKQMNKLINVCRRLT